LKAGDRQEAEMKDLDSQLIWGPWQKEVKETFTKASPILDKFPSLDHKFVLYLLREQTWIAMKSESGATKD